MLRFDPFKELADIRAERSAEITSDKGIVATSATSATGTPKVARVAKVAGMHPSARNGPRLAFSAPNAEDDAVALAAIKAGDRSYGAVATTTAMGATRAYKAVERLQAAGRVSRDMKVTEASE